MTEIRRHPWAVILCCVFLFQHVDAGPIRSLSPPNQLEIGQTETQPGWSPEISAAIETRVVSGRGLAGRAVRAVEGEQLRALYEPDNCRPLWLDAAGRDRSQVKRSASSFVGSPRVWMPMITMVIGSHGSPPPSTAQLSRRRPTRLLSTWL